MRIVRRLAAIAMLLGAPAGIVPPPAIARSQAGAAPARVVVRFAPPLDRVLRFRVTRMKYQDGKPTLPKPLSWVEELRYERAGDGYTLYWRMDPASLPPEMKLPLIAPAVAPMSGAPLAFDLDASGEVVRAHDWPAMRRTLQASVASVRPMIAAQPGMDAAKIDQVMARVAGLFDHLTPESAPGMILINIAPILGWTGIDMTVGQTNEAEVAMPVALLDTTGVTHARLTLTAFDGDTATITDRETVDAAGLAKLGDRMAAKLGGKRPDPAELASLVLVRNLVVQIDIRTGIVARFASEQRGGEAGPLVDQLTVVWLR